jgi:hypothetical protein
MGSCSSKHSSATGFDSANMVSVSGWFELENGRRAVAAEGCESPITYFLIHSTEKRRGFDADFLSLVGESILSCPFTISN